MFNLRNNTANHRHCKVLVCSPPPPSLHPPPSSSSPSSSSFSHHHTHTATPQTSNKRRGRPSKARDNAPFQSPFGAAVLHSMSGPLTVPPPPLLLSSSSPPHTVNIERGHTHERSRGHPAARSARTHTRQRRLSSHRTAHCSLHQVRCMCLVWCVRLNRGVCHRRKANSQANKAMVKRARNIRESDARLLA